METAPIIKAPDTVKSKHLNAGEKPIMVCLGMPEEEKIKEFIETSEKGAFIRILKKIKEFLKNPNKESNIDYLDYSITNKNKLDNFKNAGKYTYLISSVDNKDKFSNYLIDCTSVIAVGRDRDTHQNISFASHQSPRSGLGTNKNNFEKDLNNQLLELKNKSENGTVDIIIVGGKYVDQKDYKELYLKSIKFLTEEVKKVFNFEPVVVAGGRDVGFG